MSVHQAGQTASFTVSFDDAYPSASRRAFAILDTCQHDFAILCDWFGVDGFGPDDRIAVIVGGDRLYTGGSNDGYSAGASRVRIDSMEGPPTQELGDTLARAVSVRELSLVLMAYRNHRDGRTTWDPNTSDGQGLANVCREAMYAPTNISPVQDPQIQWWWLSIAGPLDFVSRSGGMWDADAIGCAVIFIFYLISQLGFSLHSVIEAGGPTLEATYNGLTGQSGGYAALMSVMRAFYAPDASFADDPFPLLDAADRSVSLSARVYELHREPAGHGTFTMPLPFPCRGEHECHYRRYDVRRRVHVVAIPHGFADPRFEWSIGGADVPAAGGRLPVRASSWPNEPGLPADPLHATPLDVEVLCDRVAPGPDGGAPFMLNRLMFTVPSVGMQLGIVVGCRVTDQVSPGVTNPSYVVEVDTRDIVVDDACAEEINACHTEALKLVEPRFKVDPLLRIIPDPPPDFVRAMTTLSVLLGAMGSAERSDKEWAEQLRGFMRDYLHVPSAALRPEGGIEQ